MHMQFNIIAHETYAAHNAQTYIIPRRELMLAKPVIDRGIRGMSYATENAMASNDIAIRINRQFFLAGLGDVSLKDAELCNELTVLV